MKYNKRYCTSPYLYIKKNRDSSQKIRLYDFLKNQHDEVSIDMHDLLVRSRLGIDGITLLKHYPETLIDKAIDAFYLLENGKKWCAHSLQAVEIETSTLCNWKCEYCPGSFSKREPTFMEESLFSRIIKKIAAYPGIRYVALHLYNEPTIDPRFRERVLELTRHNLSLSLATNGEYLNDELIHFLKDIKLFEVIINFPSIYRDEFIYITGCKHYEQVETNIRNALRSGLPVKLSVHTNQRQEVMRYFSLSKNQMASFETTDRAGHLKNQYGNHVALDRTALCGCILLNQRMYININGRCIICCQDFSQKYQYASIDDGSLSDIFADGLKQYRQQAFGELSVQDDFICTKCQVMKNTASKMRFLTRYQDIQDCPIILKHLGQIQED